METNIQKKNFFFFFWTMWVMRPQEWTDHQYDLTTPTSILHFLQMEEP